MGRSSSSALILRHEAAVVNSVGAIGAGTSNRRLSTKLDSSLDKTQPCRNVSWRAATPPGPLETSRKAGAPSSSEPTNIDLPAPYHLAASLGAMPSTGAAASAQNKSLPEFSPPKPFSAIGSQQGVNSYGSRKQQNQRQMNVFGSQLHDCSGFLVSSSHGAVNNDHFLLHLAKPLFCPSCSLFLCADLLIRLYQGSTGSQCCWRWTGTAQTCMVAKCCEMVSVVG